MTFNHTPSSLKSLSKTEIEKSSTVIRSFKVNFESGFSKIIRGESEYGEFDKYLINLNIYSDSLITWERAIGIENIGQIIKFRELKNTYSNNQNIGIINMDKTPMSMYWSVWSPNGLSQTIAESSSNFSEILTLPNDEESIQYGDNTSYYTANALIYNDYLVGWKNTDELYGLLGNDTLDGQAGDDVLYGGYGKDILLGGDGNDVLYGEQSNDSILGGAGNDYIEGGLGLDTMNGGEGNDTYLIDNPKDVVIDGNGSDTILIPVYMNFSLPNNIEGVRLTGNENISATGNSLNNTLTGNEGENSLNGAIGNDTINAGSGDDTLTGGSGKDIMSGGVGADVFSYQSVTESDIINANAFDMIKDFNLTEGDKINLSAIDAKSGGNANDSFSFYSAAPKTAGVSSNGAVWFSNGFLYASNDTDIEAEFKVALTGASNITASSIIL